MTNEPNDRVGETPTLNVEAVVALCRIYFEIAAEAIGEDEVRRRRDERIPAAACRTPSSTDDERAVLTELLRLYDEAERAQNDDGADHPSGALFTEWHAAWDRAREVLARRTTKENGEG